MSKNKTPPASKNEGKKGPGRPQKINKENTAILLAMFREDATQEEACAEAGISTDTLQRKMASDEGFLRQVSQARAYAKRVARQSVVKQMQTDGDLALDYLKLRDPRYKPKVRAEHTDEERAAQIRALEEAGMSFPEYEQAGDGLLPLNPGK